MKEYELIIETTQPPCGGKPPRLYDFREIETDDPIAYVKAIEKDSNLTVSVEGDGSITVIAEKDKHHVEYKFSEI